MVFLPVAQNTLFKRQLTLHITKLQKWKKHKGPMLQEENV